MSYNVHRLPINNSTVNVILCLILLDSNIMFIKESEEMLPIERQHRIKELIQDNQNMKISELSKLLAVSEMTIHRDLKPLIEEGILAKTFGGIILVNDQQTQKKGQACVFCNSSIHEKTVYRLILLDNKIEMACCAHCGLLRHRQLGTSVIQAISYDFLRQTTISAPLAWYVFDTSIEIGCCQPQVLMFEWEEHANQFVKGFGGNVYPFHEAIEVVFDKMNEKSQSCHRNPST